jgi:hypothetical protein
MVWKPGQSGNPLGRPKGARNLATVAVEKMLQGELNSITRKCIDMALAGEPVALKLCLERLMPPLKGRHLQLDLPAVTDAASALAAMSKVTKAVGNGEITTDDAAAVAGIIEINRRTVETANLERRIRALEQATGTGGNCGDQEP